VLFNSYVFWCFFLAVFVLYRLLPHRRQNVLLLVASYVFYASWDWRFLSLILTATIVNFWAGRGIGRTDATRRRKLYLAVAVATCLGILGVFKYFGFFAAQFVELCNAVGIPASPPTLTIILPVGISFYTFQTMGYSIDVYRRKAQATESVLDLALFVAFFPQLVAGPIERYTRLMPQIQRPRRHGEGDFAEGLHHVLMGLFTKVVVADNMAGMVDLIFATPAGPLSGAESLVGIYAFAFQIYGDFAGYSFVAMGVAKWLGFDLMYNFRSPYFADTPSDFWARWHISLSSWLRDYLYIPLGGNRAGRGKTVRNLIVTMGLGGLWHGAAWTFVVWGLYHGLLLVVYRALGVRGRGRAERRRPAWRGAVAVIVMFHLACLGWLLFRAQSMSQVWMMLREMAVDFRVTHLTLYVGAMVLFFVSPLLVYEWWMFRKDDPLALLKVRWPARAAVYAYAAIMLWYFSPKASHEFIYFQF